MNFNGGSLTSDAGLLMIYDFMRTMGFENTISKIFATPRKESFRKHSDSSMLRKASMAFVKMSMPERYGDLDKSSTAYAQLVTEDGLVKESGLYYDRSIHAKRSSVLSYNIKNRKELWAKSCEYCGL